MSTDLTLFPIRTEADYRAALARAEAFFDAPEEPDPDSEEGAYFEALELRPGRLLGEILSNAAADAGSFWYTAWTEAGRPALR